METIEPITPSSPVKLHACPCCGGRMVIERTEVQVAVRGYDLKYEVHADCVSCLSRVVVSGSNGCLFHAAERSWQNRTDRHARLIKAGELEAAAKILAEQAAKLRSAT